jgi:hypothetical protein
MHVIVTVVLGVLFVLSGPNVKPQAKLQAGEAKLQAGSK